MIDLIDRLGRSDAFLLGLIATGFVAVFLMGYVATDGDLSMTLLMILLPLLLVAGPSIYAAWVIRGRK